MNFPFDKEVRENIAVLLVFISFSLIALFSILEIYEFIQKLLFSFVILMWMLFRYESNKNDSFEHKSKLIQKIRDKNIVLGMISVLWVVITAATLLKIDSVLIKPGLSVVIIVIFIIDHILTNKE